MAMTRYWASRCWYWGRAIWPIEPHYSSIFRQFRTYTEPATPPLASETGGTKWVVNLLWPQELELEKGDFAEIHIERSVAWIETGSS